MRLERGIDRDRVEARVNDKQVQSTR
jgi:hypothetical protein